MSASEDCPLRIKSDREHDGILGVELHTNSRGLRPFLDLHLGALPILPPAALVLAARISKLCTDCWHSCKSETMAELCLSTAYTFAFTRHGHVSRTTWMLVAEAIHTAARPGWYVKEHLGSDARPDRFRRTSVQQCGRAITHYALASGRRRRERSACCVRLCNINTGFHFALPCFPRSIEL